MSDERLAQLLGGAPPDAIAALPLADQDKLIEVIVAARHNQSRDLAASFEATLKHVPFPLRGVIKRVLLK